MDIGLHVVGRPRGSGSKNKQKKEQRYRHRAEAILRADSRAGVAAAQRPWRKSRQPMQWGGG